MNARPFNRKLAWEQNQMGELMKNVDPTLMEIGMDENYEEGLGITEEVWAHARRY